MRLPVAPFWSQHLWKVFVGVLAVSTQTSIGFAYDAPGLGVELEVAQIIYQPLGKSWALLQGKDAAVVAKRQKLKGATIEPVGFATKTPKLRWKITAETRGDQEPYTELIVDHRLNPVGADGQMGAIAKQIVDYMKTWSPCAEKQCRVNIENFDDEFNEWKVLWPGTKRPFQEVSFSPQCTAGVPLEGILKVLQDGKDGKKRRVNNPLANMENKYHEDIVIPDKNDFKDFDIDGIDDEFLGFFALLTTYCVVSKDNVPEFGPKRSLNIMPRTSLLAMYKQFIEDKLKEAFECHTLLDIVEKVSGNSNIGRNKFKWTPDPNLAKSSENWEGKATDFSSGTLTVEKFLNTLQGIDSKGTKTKQLDLLQIMDGAIRYGQIGGLGDRMESVWGKSSRPVPVVEFRDLAPVQGEALVKRMEEYEGEVYKLHQGIKLRGPPGRIGARPPTKQIT